MHRTVADAADVLDSLGIPWTNVVWPHGKLPSLPYAVLVPQPESGIKADNTHIYAYTRYAIELYSIGRNVALEKAMRSAMADAGIPCKPDGVAPVEDSAGVIVSYFATTLIEQEPQEVQETPQESQGTQEPQEPAEPANTQGQEQGQQEGEG